MGLLDHKTAVITGANSGIGLAIADRFIAEGADRVFITGRRQPELSAAAAQLGSRAVAVPGDVGTPQDLDRLYAEVDAAGKGLDVVVANAGSTRVARLGEITDDDLDALLTTNVKGVVYTVQKALPLLNDDASIILLGSTTADRGRPGLSVYAASKAAVRSLARAWANELADRSIRVNVLVAGSTATPGSDNLAAHLVFDLFSPALARRLTKKSARMLDNAPFKFAPADGVGYFEKLGWITANVESVLLAANRFHRLSRLMRLVTYVPQPNPRKLGNMPWNAVIRLSVALKPRPPF